jgi:tRNA pseudouridine38-40 synthase
MRYALRLAYDGTGLAGWWRQPDQPSIASLVDHAFGHLGESAVQVVGASRTDAGVHARAQVAHVDLGRPWRIPDLVRGLNRHLPSGIVCTGAAPVAEDWHAVFGVAAKTYRYAVDLAAIPDPLQARWVWRPPYRLDPTLLPTLAHHVTTLQDAGGFRRRGDAREDLGLRIRDCRWHHQRDRWICSLTADRFTYRLVRSLVGAMLATAQGTCRHDDFIATLAGHDTPAGHQQAPAHGLHLWHVRYRHPPLWQVPP